MISSIIWGVFLLFVLLAVPIVSLLDRRGRPAPEPNGLAADDKQPMFDDSMGGEDAFDQVPEVLPADANDPFASGGNFGGGDDFGAFEDDFK